MLHIPVRVHPHSSLLIAGDGALIRGDALSRGSQLTFPAEPHHPDMEISVTFMREGVPPLCQLGI